MLRIETRDPEHLAQVAISATGYPAAWPSDGWRFHGTAGTLRADGQFSYRVQLHRTADPPDRWEELPVPQRILAAHPSEGDEFQRKWACLARDFVANIRGEPHQPYLTFRDSARFQAAFDAIRAGAGWLGIESVPGVAGV